MAWKGQFWQPLSGRVLSRSPCSVQQDAAVTHTVISSRVPIQPIPQLEVRPAAASAQGSDRLGG